MGLSLIIPAYNEGERIGNTLEEYARFFLEKKESKKINDFELVVVLNGCKDNTIEVVKKYQKRFKQLKYLDFKEAGKGFAIIQGFKHALHGKNEFIGFVDADLATSPNEFYKLFLSINENDGVIGSRWLENSLITTKQPFLRRFLSRGFNMLVRFFLILPYRDTQCGAKIFRKAAIEKTVNKLKMSQWAFDIELLYLLNKNGFKIKEVPTVWNDKKGSKLNITKVPIQMFLSIVRVRMLYSPFKRLVEIYDQLPERFKIHQI